MERLIDAEMNPVKFVKLYNDGWRIKSNPFEGKMVYMTKESERKEGENDEKNFLNTIPNDNLIT